MLVKVRKDKSLFNDWEVSIIRSFEEIEKIRPVWEQIQHSQAAPLHSTDIDRYLSILEPIRDTVQPYIIVLHHNGHPRAMMIGHIGNMRIRCKIGYLTLPSPTLRCLSITYGGILGQPNSEMCSALIEELMRTLNNGEADMVLFDHLPTHSEMHRLARTKPSIICRGHFPKVDLHWRMSVPESIELFYKKLSGGHRRNIKRTMRKLEDEYSVRIATYTRSDGLEEAVTAAAEISSKTYQHALGSGFVDSTQKRSQLTTAAEHGWLRLHILLINDQSCAFQLALQYHRTYFLIQIGYDPQWKKWRIGTTLFLKVLEELCGDGAVDSLDFGFGDADYKRSYGDNHWPEATIYLFAPRFYPILSNMLQSCVAGLNLGLAYISDRSGLTRWIKRKWRNLLQKDKNA